MPFPKYDARGFCTCRSHSAQPWNRPEHWSAAEVAHLEQWFGWRSDEQLAAELGRTAVGIRLKAKRLGLHKKDAGYTATELGRLLGVDPSVVSKSWIRRGLLGSHRSFHQGPHRVHLVQHSDVVAFIREHGEWIDHAKVPDDSPFVDEVGANRWYSLPQVHAVTGRQNVDIEIRAGLIEARKKGAHWMVPETELPKIRRLDPEHISESVWRKQRVLRVRREARHRERRLAVAS